MKWGLRVQLLLLLGALLLLFYVPLFFATSTYTRIGLEQLQRANARKLGRSVATQLAALREQSDDDHFVELARTLVGEQSVHALSLHRAEGQSPLVLGEVELLSAVEKESGFGQVPEVRQLRTPKGAAILVYHPSTRGGVSAIVRVDAEVTRATTLARLMGLYMAVGGVALLAAAYFALTRWIVRPILTLERGAERIAQGARQLSPLSQAPRELQNLAGQLSAMTGQLRDEEQALRDKVTELQGRTNELRQAQASLIRSERLATVGRLAAGLAHEVGNPISALMGLQDLVLEGGLTKEEERDFLERMRRETARIDRVIADLLAYARPGGGRLRSGGKHASGSLGAAIADVTSLLTPQSALKAIRFQIAIEPNLPPAELDQEELTQVLLNLVMNAADACGTNGTIEISALRLNTETLELRVDDDGPGIPPEVTDSLFEPFVSTKDVGKGTGLGLSVTRGLVESAGGTVTTERSPLGGARFLVHLPVVATIETQS